MHEVTVNRIKLLKKIKENRAKHHDLFIKAQEGYRKKVIEELDIMIQEARNGDPIRRSIDFPAPIDKTGEYDLVITMLEMSVDEIITLDAYSFNCYVLDKWDWSEFALVTNSQYIGGRKEG